ncbi:potassium transporter TrkA [Tistrella bauzanensis]|uniref:Potassium transporter TrkA n=1 Tax=Tistrella bauzanensis TaxID=657419 RepID=A0ABQ1J4Q6_9PROT|nr:cation:proton antiporter [Tistrella bauzanensis]GGB59889.1 potassium transporter TrkA [Tistrella bauzanensis]
MGPHGFGLVDEGPALHLFAEFGVVFLLFSIGLELSFERMRTMRRLVLGLGLTQVLVTGAIAAGIGMALGLAPVPAMIIGGALALSSTAVVLQLLVERGEQVTRIGRVAIAVLLFQDLAVVPMLAALPLLAAPGGDALAALGLAVAKAAVALVGISLAGRYLSQPAFRRIAALRNPDVFMGATLLVVLGTSLLTALAGMSLALGAFLAGALLAGTAFRHQIEGDIEPVRGLFLGVFFLSVGMGVDLGVVVAEWPLVLALTLGLLAVKTLVLAGLGRIFGLPVPLAARSGLLLAQGGEFAFVVIGTAGMLGLVAGADAAPVTAAVALTMAVTPLLDAMGRRLERRLTPPAAAPADQLGEEAADLEAHVVILGFGRVGRTVAHVLEHSRSPYLALDLDSDQVADGRLQGHNVFFGDGARRDVLRAAGIERAAAVVVTVDHAAAAERAVRAIRHAAPGVAIVARAHDAHHAERLRHAGAGRVLPETIEASLLLAAATLDEVGREAEDIEACLGRLRADGYAQLLPLVVGRRTEGEAEAVTAAPPAPRRRRWLRRDRRG